jgi:hypothetical protein
MKKIDCPSCGIEISDLPLKLQKRKLLLVEGRDEEEFFNGLLRSMEIDDIQIIPVGGKNQFSNNLKGLIKDSDFSAIISMGIVRDADDDPKATLQSIGDALKQAGLPVPQRVMTKAKQNGSPDVIIMILPNANKRGALEDLCLAAVKEDKASTCVERYLSCLKKKNIAGPKQKWLNKARVRVFLSSKEEPTLSLGIAAQRGYWPFDHNVFDDVKKFLKSV